MTRERKVMSRAELWSGVILAIGILLFILSAFAMGLHYLREEPDGILDGWRAYGLIGGFIIAVVGVCWNLRLHKNK